MGGPNPRPCLSWAAPCAGRRHMARLPAQLVESCLARCLIIIAFINDYYENDYYTPHTCILLGFMFSPSRMQIVSATDCKLVKS